MSCSFTRSIWNPISATLLFAGLVILSPSIATGATFFLADGSRVEGAYVGSAADQVTIINEQGDRQLLPRAGIQFVDWSHKLSPKLEQRAARERSRFTKARQREVSRLLKRYGKAKPEARLEIQRQLDGFEEPELFPALAEGLGSARSEVRALALARLRAFESAAVVIPLVRAAITNSDETFARSAHEAAVARDADLARRTYEYAAQVSPFPQRVRSVRSLQEIGQGDSVLTLVRVLAYVESNIRAQLVRLKRMREVPVSLGSGASNVTIELPEVELIEVMTTTRVPVETLQLLRSSTVGALQSITGETFGNDVEAWREWLQAREKARSGRGSSHNLQRQGVPAVSLIEGKKITKIESGRCRGTNRTLTSP